MTIITSILGWALSNPMMILAAIGIWFASSWISDARGFFHQRDLMRPWVQAVAERDAAIEKKDALTQEALESRENFRHELAQAQAQLDEYEIARKVDDNCIWSDDDIRMLNAAAK